MTVIHLSTYPLIYLSTYTLLDLQGRLFYEVQITSVRVHYKLVLCCIRLTNHSDRFGLNYFVIIPQSSLSVDTIT